MPFESKLFSPVTVRGLTLRNRIVLSPLCMYSAKKGLASDFHASHLSAFARGGVGLVFTEATAVEPRGRITAKCLGIWNDAQVEAFKPITRFITEMGAVPAIQLAHAGRKASSTPPWGGGKPVAPDDTTWGEGGWQTVAPSGLPLADGWPSPKALSVDEIVGLIAAFADAAKRALAAGFKVIEIHGAHGYLIHSFLSPATNQRNDAYGGDLEGRMRFALEVSRAVRAVWPEDLPLFFRISAVDTGGWSLEDSVTLAKALKAIGVDVIDCSSGGIAGAPAFRASDDGRPLPAGGQRPLGFQVPYAEAMEREAGIAAMAVGRIVDGQQAEDILQEGRASFIALGRELMHDPFWPLHAAEALGEADAFSLWPEQYRWAIVRRAELGQYQAG